MVANLSSAILQLATSVRQKRKRIKRSMKMAIRRWVATRRRKQSKARFIIVTGSSGKTTTVRLLDHILAGKHLVVSQSGQNSVHDATDMLRKLKGDEEFVIMEAGTAGPGELAGIASVFRPHVAVVTLVALEHYSAFRSLAAIAAEKAKVIEALDNEGVAILNFDSPEVRAMDALTKARVVGFGLQEGLYRASDRRLEGDGTLEFTLGFDGRAVRVDTPFLGEHNWLSATAAAACALELGVDPQEVAARIASFEPMPGRMTRHTLPDGTTFILDTVKAPYHSILLPLQMLPKLDSRRKRVVIGQISDYPGNSKPKYRDTYLAARTLADEVIIVGPNSMKVKPTPEDASSGRLRRFERVEDAAAYLAETASPGDLVLVKSSQNLHLERLLLMRQTKVACWVEDCRMQLTCLSCGLYGAPFAEHEGRRRKSRSKKELWRR